MLTTHNARGEHILWMSPMVYTWLATYTSPIQMVVFYANNKYYLLSYLSTTFLFILIMAVPYLLHKHFRENETRNIVVSWLHIISSVTIMIAILMIYTYTPPINRDWMHEPIVAPGLARWRFFNDFAFVLLQSFIFIQVLFTGYGVRKLFLQSRENQDYQISISDDFASA